MTPAPLTMRQIMFDRRVPLAPWLAHSTLSDEQFRALSPQERTDAILFCCQTWQSQAEVSESNRRRRAPKISARQMLNRAVKAGKVVKPDACQVCGIQPTTSRDIQGHHRDYSKPLDVDWLCRPCHVRAHRRAG